eukprot:6469418-Amphidinium_carterae.1
MRWPVACGFVLSTLVEAQDFRLGNTQTKWKEKHAKVREEHGIGEGIGKWSTHHQLHGIPRTSERTRDCIDLAYQVVMKKGSQTDLSKMVVDVSQDGSRKPWSAMLRSVTRSSVFYHFGEDRLLSSKELLACFGWCVEDLCLQDMSEAQIRDLIG